MVILGLADIKDLRKELPKPLLRELQPRIDQPTLGKWQGMCLAVAKHLPANQSRILELKATLTKSLVPFLDGAERKRTPETSFSALRNQLAHGGGVTKVVAFRLLDIWKDKFEEVIVACSWLRKFALVVKTEADSFGVLCGPTPNPTLYTPQGDAEQQALDSVFEHGDEVAFVRGQAVVPLWPMSIYGLPSLSDPEAPIATLPIPQIYVRRGEVFLQFTPVGSDEFCQSEGNESALSEFLNLFRFHDLEAEYRRSGFTVRGFDIDLRKDSDRLVGRMEELSKIHEAIEQKASGILWLSGSAGIGKSYIISRIAVDLLEKQQEEHSCTLPFRFKAGDGRCSREQFLRFAIERLKVWKPIENEAQKDKGQKKPIDEFKDLLGRLPKGMRIIFILDGLDELAEHDSMFAQEIPLSLSFEGVLWLCAGRPERGLPEAFTLERCQHVFPEGLSPMSTGDIRTMLIEKIGPLRRRLVSNDSELDGAVVNPFINKVAKSAQGFPLYVTYVIGDVLSGRFRALDAGERLPPSLEQYHAELLKRCAVGMLNQIVTPMAATLAVSHEPLSLSTLVYILQLSDLLPDEDGQQLVKRALLALGAMLKRSQTPDGEEGYQLYHHSLRQHMQESPETKGALDTARKRLCRIIYRALESCDWSASNYFLRYGANHLIESDRWKEATMVLSSPAFLERRSKLQGQSSYNYGLSLIANEPIIEEYRIARTHFADPLKKEMDLQFWSSFLQMVASDPSGGVWFRTLLKRYAKDMPAGVFDALIQDTQCQNIVVKMIESLFSGFGWQAEFGATAPADVAVSFIQAAGRAKIDHFLNRIKNVKVGPWAQLLEEEAGAYSNATGSLWEQDMRHMYYAIQTAVDGALQKKGRNKK